MMEKYEDGIQNTLCMACLCVGRSLQALRDDKLIKFYLDTLSEIPLCNTPTVAPLVCWECTALLRKVLSFREQVKDSYRILQTYTHENLYECLLSDVSRAPRLKVHVNTPVVIAAHGDGEAVKEEVKIEWSDECQNDGVDDSGAITKDGAIRSEKEEREKRTAVGTKRDGGKQDRSKIRRKQSKNSSLNGDLTKSLPEMSSSADPQTELRDDVLLCEFKFETGYCKSEQDNLELSDADQNNGLASDVSDKEEEISNLREVKVKQAKKTVRSKIRKAESIVKKLQGVKKVRKQKLTTNQKILTLELSYEEMMAEREKDAERDSYTKAKYKCDTCLIGFNHYKSHNAHFAAKHSPEIGDYICPICKTIISSVESFTAHYKRHMRRYECQLCRKRTSDVKAMQQHYYSTHEISLKQYKCNLCGQLSSSIDTHRYHKDTHKARVQCGECDKTFSHRAGLMNHRLAVHQFHNEFPCTVCDKVFRWKTSLKRHLEKHDVKGAVGQAGGAYCRACDVGFSSVCSLQRHLRNSLRHVTPDQLRFICDHCGRRFADKTKLRDHIEEKHLHRTYTCHICQKTSKNRVGLEQHVRNVHKGRPNNKICHHCGKGFPTKVQLESHIRTHTGERPFICEYCPTTFSQQSNLYKHHRQVHLNIKRKRYPLCTKKRAPLASDAAAPAHYTLPDGMFAV